MDNIFVNIKDQENIEDDKSDTEEDYIMQAILNKDTKEVMKHFDNIFSDVSPDNTFFKGYLER